MYTNWEEVIMGDMFISEEVFRNIKNAKKTLKVVDKPLMNILNVTNKTTKILNCIKGR